MIQFANCSLPLRIAAISFRERQMRIISSLPTLVYPCSKSQMNIKLYPLLRNLYPLIPISETRPHRAAPPRHRPRPRLVPHGQGLWPLPQAQDAAEPIPQGVYQDQGQAGEGAEAQE